MIDLAALAIGRLGFLSSVEKIILYEAAPTIARLGAIGRPELETILRRRVMASSWPISDLERVAEEDAGYLERRAISGMLYSEMPAQLREIYDPPFLLYLRGRLPDLYRPWIALVGTRVPSHRGRQSAIGMGRGFGSAGIPVVSGLARGIDAMSQQATIDAGGVSVAVLGCGIDRIYPANNRLLAERLLEMGGAIISEYAPGVPPSRHRFPARNRIISGLARGVVIVEAPQHSGALITADYALEQGRDLYVHADCLEGKQGAGAASLAENGAPKVSSHQDILRDWNWKEPAPREDREASTTPIVAHGLSEMLAEQLAQELQV